MPSYKIAKLGGHQQLLSSQASPPRIDSLQAVVGRTSEKKEMLMSLKVEKLKGGINDKFFN
jgi:hypothetical protein